eukprot:CAMPEP_0172301048 /NCGR_PEP_ID=MMETSP1058-20130122/3018_1 /TAXON_ID=83371 /ORGANISM="Detonula confervacea, Strain CCMP 353" /LENGTH=267 /DNA_ID=CAMNT_0013011037 /DNA_START=112 /DNA_END=915 /DNA_ORIENTATION=-
MSAPLHHFTKDLYKLLHLPRTATQNEVKQSYRKIALALHPDRHDGCEIKTSAFKEVSEAYRVLSDHRKRVEYDRWIDGVSMGADGKVRKKGMSRAAERNPFYRKVYSPAAPPGMKTFDRQRHFDMHYGQGMMKEEIERARKRAEAASPRTSGYSYQSPLGSGFTFNKEQPLGEQTNPYSRKGKRQHDHINKNGEFRIEYEETYFDMDGSDLSDSKRAMRGKEYVVERMNRRRKNRVRERGEPQPYQSRRADSRGVDNDAESSGCVIM